MVTGGSRQDDPRGQSGRRGDVPPGHRAPPGERRGVLDNLRALPHPSHAPRATVRQPAYTRGEMTPYYYPGVLTSFSKTLSMLAKPESK